MTMPSSTPLSSREARGPGTAVMGEGGGAAGVVVGVDTRVEVETAAAGVGVDRGAGMGGIENGRKIWAGATRGAVTGAGETCCSLGQEFKQLC